jgi:hypothetical protein
MLFYPRPAAFSQSIILQNVLDYISPLCYFLRCPVLKRIFHEHACFVLRTIIIVERRNYEDLVERIIAVVVHPRSGSGSRRSA